MTREHVLFFVIPNLVRDLRSLGWLIYLMTILRIQRELWNIG
jgi:hypothetical protein